MYDRTSGCGIAMKNAKEIAKSSAKVVLDRTNDEDGVAYYIMQEFRL